MKTLTSAAFALALTVCFGQAFHIDLVSFGSADYSVAAEATTAPYTQNVLGLTFSPAVAAADTIGGTFNSAPLDWSSYDSQLSSNIFLKIVFTGANPNLPISLSIFDSTLTFANTYSGTTTTGDEDYYTLSLVGSYLPAVSLSAGGAQLTWDGGSNLNASVQSIATVPEPSTYALLGLAGLALAGYTVRRRRA